MDTKPLVSVLVPIYNVERYLRQCLESLSRQTMQEIEFICLNDGSTDSSLDIAKEYAARDQRFIVVNKTNSGYGATMNAGLKRARGEYIGIVESDDWVEADCFESLYKLASLHRECDIIKANYYQFDSTAEQFKENYSVELCAEPISAGSDLVGRVILSVPAIWAALYRTEFLREHQIDFLETPGASYQDTGFVLKSWIAADSILLTHDAYLHYRIGHAGSSSVSDEKVYYVCDEFSSIDSFAAKFPDRMGRIGGALAAKRYRTYRWNLLRINQSSRKDFLLRTSKELGAIREQCKEGAAYLGKRQRKELFQWIDDPLELYYDLSLKEMDSKVSPAALMLRLQRKLHKLFPTVGVA